jgi:2-oxoglutarate ferredoxin oxidoreductase subunit delta
MKDKTEESKQASKDKDTNVLELPGGKVVILKNRCKGCGFCIEFCPKKSMEFSQETNSKGYRIPCLKNPEKCLLCGFCSKYCPDFAIFQIKNKGVKEGDDD